VVDVFDEVEEEIRFDRYRTLLRRFGPWVAGALVLALLVALGVWGYQTWRQHEAAKASETYAAALEAFAAHDTTKAMGLWAEVAKSPSKGYRALALMQEGGVRQTENKTTLPLTPK